MQKNLNLGLFLMQIHHMTYEDLVHKSYGLLLYNFCGAFMLFLAAR